MKKITLLFFAFLVFNLNNAQTNLFFDDFESYTDFIITGIGSWETLDLDGLNTYVTDIDYDYPNAGAAMAFQIFNPSTTTVGTPSAGTPSPATNATSPPDAENRNFDPFSGNKYAGAWGAVPSTTGGPTANDDWLISPVITLAASGNSLTYQIKALSDTYGDESYQIGVYVGTGSPTGSSDFTILGGTRTATYPAWEEVVVDLGAYDGMDIRIGIHYISSDVYLLMVDDVSVDTTLSVDQFNLNSFSHNYDKASQLLKLESSSMAMTNVEIYSILGQNIMSQSLNGQSESIDISSLNDGVYIAKVFVDDDFKTIKFVKN